MKSLIPSNLSQFRFLIIACIFGMAALCPMIGNAQIYVYDHECPVISPTVVIGCDLMVLNSELQFL